MFARQGVLVTAVAFWATMAPAQEVPVEVSTLGASVIALHLHPFLTEEELATLRVVATNEEALAIFVPGKLGFAALAVSPEDGFIRLGAPMGSATAVGDLPDAETARAKALEGCDALRQGTLPCVPVLEIAPAP
jgi:hypothetical protein